MFITIERIMRLGEALGKGAKDEMLKAAVGIRVSGFGFQGEVAR